MTTIQKLVKASTYALASFFLVLVLYREEFYDGVRLRFWDMTATLEKWPRCFEIFGLNTFAVSNQSFELQGECSRFNYGIFTMPLYKSMALVSENAFIWSASLFFLMFVLIIVVTKKDYRIHLIVFVVLISPPFTLLFESGNPDLLNVILCQLAGIAIFKRWVLTMIFSSSIVALHKYYGVIIWVVALVGFLRGTFFRKLLAWSVISASLLTISYQVLIMGLYKFSDAGANHYGIAIWDNYLRKIGFNIDENLIQAMGILSLIVVSAYLVRKAPIKLEELKPISIPSSTALVFYLVFMFSYIATANVDYRLAFLGIALIMDAEHYLFGSFISRLFLGVIVISMYLTYPMGYHELLPGLPLQAIGDLTLHAAVTYTLARTWYLLKRLKMDLSEDQVKIG